MILRVHPAMFRNRPVSFVLSCLLVPVVVGIVILVIWYIKTRNVTLTITDERATLREGIFSKSTSELRHQDVRNIQVHQDFLQRLTNVGDVELSSAGQAGIEIRVPGVPEPNRIADLVREYQID